MEKLRLSAVRRFMLWWFSKPTGAYVSANVAIDFHNARAYLADLEGIGINALVCAAIARVLHEHPFANRRIVGRNIYQAPSVGLAMPVNLVGHEGEKRMEVSMTAVREVDGMSLRRLQEITTKQAKTERSGRLADNASERITRVVEAMPDAVNRRIWSLLGRGAHSPMLAGLMWKRAPVTAAASNVGSTFRGVPGIWFRGASFSPPERLLHLGTIWGISGVVDEVVPVDGVPTVRPILPIVLIFDHRLFDGVRAGRLMGRLAEILTDPAETFGPTGDALIGADTRPRSSS